MNASSAGSLQGVSLPLLALFVLYTLASLVHFTHNAEFLADYPGLPNWLTRAQVYVAWLVVFAIGLTGLLLVRAGKALAGLVILVIYAVLGFAGLDHYFAAPFSAHTFTMNFTIWFEVAAAFALLVYLLAAIRAQLRAGKVPSTP